MEQIIHFLSFWGHAAVGFLFAALATWTIHKYGTANRQQIVLIASLALTSLWGIAAVSDTPLGGYALLGETLRNLGWLGFMFFLLHSGEGKQQPRTINAIYISLLLVLLRLL